MTGSRGIGVIGLAMATAALIGLTTTVPAGPVLTAATYYLEGTRIGDITGHATPLDFTGQMVIGSGGTAPTSGDFEAVNYPASIWPFSTGGLGDPTWNASVAQGKSNLGEQPVAGDTVVGYSQGAVVANSYKRDHLDNGVNYVLIENPGRPNGGIMARFKGLRIPILNVTFSGATPVVRDPAPGGGRTVDIARQYDGWADFPTYPLNLLATVNAVLGIIYLHGDTQDLDASAVADIDKTNPMYYQQHGDTTYYLIPTKRLPLLMPFQGLLPKKLLDAVEGPLRKIVELGYDRTDYSKPAGAQVFPTFKRAGGVAVDAGTADDDVPAEAQARASDPVASVPAESQLDTTQPDASQPAVSESAEAEAEVEAPKPAVKTPGVRKPIPLSTALRSMRRAAESVEAALRSPFAKRPVAQKPDAEKSDTKKQGSEKQEAA